MKARPKLALAAHTSALLRARPGLCAPPNRPVRVRLTSGDWQPQAWHHGFRAEQRDRAQHSHLAHDTLRHDAMTLKYLRR